MIRFGMRVLINTLALAFTIGVLPGTSLNDRLVNSEFGELVAKTKLIVRPKILRETL